MRTERNHNPRQLAGMILAGMVFTGTAQAALVARDLDAPGDAKITLDTESGLRWLDLNLTIPLAVNSANQFTAAGWSVATLTQVQDLIGHHFGSSFTNGTRIPVASSDAQAFVDLLGPTFGADIAWGRFQASSSSVAGQAIVRFDSGLESYLIQDSGFGSGEPHSFSGVFYVMTQPVPEPESYAMMLAGLGVLGAVARRRKRKAA